MYSLSTKSCFNFQLSICCCCSVVQLCLTLCKPLDCSIPGFPVLHYFPEFAHINVHWVNDAIQPSGPLSLPPPPSLNLFPASGSFPMSWLFASHGQSVGASASVLSMNIQGWFLSGLTPRFDLLAVQGTLKSLQHRSSKASILWLSALFMVHLSHPYLVNEKTIALTTWTTVSKVMSAF